MRLACLSAAKRLLGSLACGATAAMLFAAANGAHAADKQINAVPRALALAPASAPSASTGSALIVGSKRFTESYILAELLAQTAQGRGIVGVIDGSSPAGVEGPEDAKARHEFVRKIGYKL